MKGDLINSEIQLRLEEAVLKYQDVSKTGDRNEIELAYKKITTLYNPLDFYHSWYDQYYYLFDSQEDFVADYLRVFATVLLGWKPRNQRAKSRYEGSGEFKNYFIGSLYHNYINMVKSDQAAKRNITKQCPICSEWVNPISTHLIVDHSHILWQYLEEMDIDIESLSSCPLCTNFKVAKNNNDARKITELLKAHFISKHTSLLFNKFNEMYPEISTISPKITSTSVHDGDEELDLYEVVEEKNNLLSKLHFLNLTDVQKNAIEQILNGDTTLVYKPEKYKCTKEQWEVEMESLRETISIYGYE
jgi:hypothetical protein